MSRLIRLISLLILTSAFFQLSYAEDGDDLGSSNESSEDKYDLSEPVVVPEEFREDLVKPNDSRTIPFAKGEKLIYQLGWGIFHAADARLNTTQVQKDQAIAYQFDLFTKTRGFVNAIYPVDNHSKALADVGVTKSLLYAVDQNESRKERKAEINFDWSIPSAFYANLIEDSKTQPIRVMEGTFDPLSIVFFVRTLDFEVGDRLIIPTTNGKELFFTIVHVREKVRRKFKAGEFEAFVLEPDIKDLGGVFKKSKDGRVTFYFSADERKLPLRMESEVAVGSFWAELISAEIGGKPFDLKSLRK